MKAGETPAPLSGSLLEKKRPAPASVSSEEVAAIYAVFLSQMVRYYEEDPRVREIPGATAVFRQLRARGVKTALDTGFSRPILDAIIHRLDWSHPELLDATVASDEVKQGRPHPDLIFEAMRRTGVAQASRVAKVGDTPADLLEGQAAGCQIIIGVTYGSHTRAQLALEPHTHLIENLDEVLGIVAG
jgi:phosphonatase-like hydrolase